jgi:hypothetical protein
MAPVATAVYLGVLLALGVGRFRWAWIVMGSFYVAAFATWAFDIHRFAPRSLLGLAFVAVVLTLLFSAPVRDRLRRRVEMPWHA